MAAEDNDGENGVPAAAATDDHATGAAPTPAAAEQPQPQPQLPHQAIELGPLTITVAPPPSSSPAPTSPASAASLAHAPDAHQQTLRLSPSSATAEGEEGEDDDEQDGLRRRYEQALPPSSARKRTPSYLPAVDGVSHFLSRAASSILRAGEALAWRPRPPGPTDSDPAVRAFRIKLGNAYRPALAAFLSTGVSLVYPWSHKVTWFSITLSISGVGRNLGHTLEAIRQQWLGAAVAVPLCLLLGLCGFSKVLTGVLVFLVTVALVATNALTESAKKLAIIFVVWDVLIPCVQPEITLVSLLIDLLTAVLGANIVCVVVMTLPIPHPALWLVRWRLEELSAVMAKFVEDAVASFCLEDDSELYDLEGVLDEAAALLQQARGLLPDVRFELSLLLGGRRGGDRAVAYDRLARYLTVLESQVENCRGMAVALADIFPNATHGEFVRAMQPALLDLARECRVVLEGTCHHICHGLRLGCFGDGWGRRPRPAGARDWWAEEGNGGVPIELFMPPKTALSQVLSQCLKTRMRVIYGVELVVDGPATVARIRSNSAGSEHPNATGAANGTATPSSPPPPQSAPGRPLHTRSQASIAFARSAEAEAAARHFQEESGKIGYMNLIPRNTFVLDLELFVEAFDWHFSVCNSRRRDLPVRWTDRTAAWCRRLDCRALLRGWCRAPFRLPSLKSLRQPLKVGLAVLLASIVVLVDDDHLGLQTIWAPITVAQTMSSHPGSSFKSGMNRVMGTVMGAIFGLAVTQWCPIHQPSLIVLVLTLWVFVCAFNRGSATYGEVAVSAALTAPIVVVGPVVGSSGAVVRISQVILGTVIYVITDNLFFPVRAKLLLRAQLCESVRDFLHLCREGLATFLREPEPRAGSLVDADINDLDVPEKIRSALQKEALFIALATDEPELWHKPFQRNAYLKAHAIKMRMHRYLLQLHRASATFPKDLKEWEQGMMQAYASIIRRLQRTVEACLHEALARLMCLKRSSRINAVTTPKKATPLMGPTTPTGQALAAALNGWGENGGDDDDDAYLPARIPCVNLFDVRQEFSDVQETIDRLVSEIFARDPVVTPLNFIVPLYVDANGMLYSIRKMGPECVSFVTAVRELWAREKMTTRRRAEVVAAGAANGVGGGQGPRVHVKDGKARLKHF